MIRFGKRYETNLAIRLKAAYDQHNSITVSEVDQWYMKPLKDQLILEDLAGFWSLTQER